jgi:hypothetical protein
MTSTAGAEPPNHRGGRAFGRLPQRGIPRAMNGRFIGYDSHDPTGGMDEGWITEWVEFGLRELSVYLRRQAAFEAYYQRRLRAAG